MSTPLAPEQVAAMMATLAYTEPASGEQVRRALSDVQSVSGHNHQPLILERLRRAQVAVPAIVRRLLDAEAEIERLTAELAQADEALADAFRTDEARHKHIVWLEAQLRTARNDQDIEAPAPPDTVAGAFRAVLRGDA